MLIWGKKEQELFKRELELQRLEAIRSAENEVAHLRNLCAKDIASIEHDYHFKREENGIKIAKMEALTETHKMIVDEKNRTIEILRKTIEDITRPRLTGD